MPRGNHWEKVFKFGGLFLMDGFRRMLSFLVGLAIVVAGLKHECPRVATIVIGLLLMGMFSVPEALEIIKGFVKGNDD
jgi:hypothetical protein